MEGAKFKGEKFKRRIDQFSRLQKFQNGRTVLFDLVLFGMFPNFLVELSRPNVKMIFEQKIWNYLRSLKNFLS